MEIKPVKRGIGPAGKVLKDMLEEKERLFQQTGYYYGLKELRLAKEDPLRL
ncbi:MAG TPA: hypothetical protein G4O13_07315, partial [Dehalococcoidia bacterium]|nr:hypothetical protein [Dehalococcoidia bacterium]